MNKKFKYSIISFVLIILVFLAILFYYRGNDKISLIVPTISKLDKRDKAIALTFDDGPSSEKTVALLDLLKSDNVQATFFVLGTNVEKYPQIITRMKSEGHLVAGHSYSHPRMILMWPQNIREQIEKTDNILSNLDIAPSKYFRPPYMDEMLILPLILQEKEKVIVGYDVDPLAQYDNPMDAKKVSDFVIRNTQPGSIVILHDGVNSNTEEFIKAVHAIITQLKSNGYNFVRIDYP
jgi:peptidoglycan/xylan/chitin deacetylase (PgdA/CDA1 family)